MSDIQRPDSGEVVPVLFESGTNTSEELTAQPKLNLKVFLERQGVINDILNRDYVSDEARVADLNAHFTGWDDEDGISFTYMNGRTLPGLQVHIPATAIAFSANYAPGADFSGSNLDYAVFAGSVLPEVTFHDGSLDHAVMPLTRLSGRAIGVSAVKSILNFADIEGLDVRGMDIGVSYILGLQGLTPEKLASFADSQEAISLIPGFGQEADVEALLGEGLSRFAGGDATNLIRRLRYPQVFSQVDALEVILRKNLRNHRQGVILDNVMLSGSEMSKFDFEGNVWNRVITDRASAIATRMAGVVVLNSSMNDMSNRGMYAPGLVAINSGFRSSLPKNSAGAIFFECDLTNADVEGVQEGGTTIIGGKPPEVGEDMPHIRVMAPEELPPPVLTNLQRLASVQVKTQQIPSTDRQLKA